MKLPKLARKFSESKMEVNEEIINCLSGYVGEMMGSGSDRQINGVLILTNKRIVFYKKNLLVEHFRSVPLHKAASINFTKMLSHKTIHVTATPEDLVFKSFDEGAKVKSFVEQADHHIELGNVKDTSATTIINEVKSPNYLDELTKLAELKEKGILTEEEFNEQKAKILGNI